VVVLVLVPEAFVRVAVAMDQVRRPEECSVL